MQKFKNNKLFKFALIIIYLFVITLFSLTTREHKETTYKYPLDITIINTFTLFITSKLVYLAKSKEKINYFSFIFLRKHPRRRDNYSVLVLSICMSLFLSYEYIYKITFSNLSSLSVCLFSQSRLILIFLFSVFIMKKKFTSFQVIGTIMTVTSIILGSVKNENKDFCLKSAFMICLGSLLNGFSLCFFDYFIKNKITDFLFYLGDCNFIHLLIALVIKFYFLLQNFDKILFINKEILLISFLSSLVALVVIINSFFFGLLERILISFFVFIIRDFLTDLINKNRNDALRIFSYFLSLVSGLVYKGKEIKILFKK